MLIHPEPKWKNNGQRNGNFKTGLNSFRIDSLEDLLQTEHLSLILKRLKQESKYNKRTGCIEWTGHLSQWGYGMLMVGNKPRGVHRLAYLVNCGSLKGLCVLHKCDNRKCLNPRHLFLGSKTDNAKDRDNKNRQSRGERVNTAILTEAQVKRIRYKLLGKFTQKKIAEMYGVSQQVIERISRRLTWKHV